MAHMKTREKIDPAQLDIKDTVVSINRVTKVVFDRNGFLYHGRVRAVAEAARSAGLEF